MALNDGANTITLPTPCPSLRDAFCFDPRLGTTVAFYRASERCKALRPAAPVFRWGNQPRQDLPQDCREHVVRSLPCHVRRLTGHGAGSALKVRLRFTAQGSSVPQHVVW